jgi:Zn-dependent protease with chaperone function
MAMDFFESQDQARRNTGWLVVLFVLAVIGIIITVFLLIGGLFGYLGREDLASRGLEWYAIMDLDLFIIVALGVLLVVSGGTLYRIVQLRGGGTVIAEGLGGRRIHTDTRDPRERKVLNVVEEMAIASGIPAPPVFLLDQENGINAFAAGFSPNDAVIGVTAGCVDQLTRDQLQGVIAHEFSHILNGDMRLNIRLIGVLHGIMVIGILGYFVLRSALFSGGYSRSRRSNPAPLLALGFGLMVIGFVGNFFGKLIQAAVSRQREFLADASAVQFTRNPDGIAGALKRIGGFSNGSAIESPNAPESSHMFFGRAISFMAGGLFATHPPLEKRIRQIDPSWQGPFEQIEPGAQPAGLVEETAGAAGFAGAKPLASISGSEISQAMDQAVNQIGRPTEAHIRYAAELVQSLPRTVVAAARESYGARALVYALLLDADPAVRKLQLDQLSQSADAGVYRETVKLAPEVEKLTAHVRLPLIDMTIPALRHLSPTQFDSFKRNVIVLVKADNKIDLFEWTLQRIILRHVEPEFKQVKPSRVKYRGLDSVRAQCQVLLSTLAYVGQTDRGEVQNAFEQSASSLGLPGLTLEPPEKSGLGALDRALDVLDEVTPRLKRQLIQACAVCIRADRKVTVDEAELLRAIADTLECPMPPLLPGQAV